VKRVTWVAALLIASLLVNGWLAFRLSEQNTHAREATGHFVDQTLYHLNHLAALADQPGESLDDPALRLSTFAAIDRAVGYSQGVGQLTTRSTSGPVREVTDKIGKLSWSLSDYQRTAMRVASSGVQLSPENREVLMTLPAQLRAAGWPVALLTYNDMDEWDRVSKQLDKLLATINPSTR
jgi:hypothetical protein